MNFLNEQKASGHLVTEWLELEELYNKKLWHQLTLKIQQIVHKPELSHNGTLLIDLYDKFITDFEHRINQLSLVEICLPIIRQYKEANQALAFIDKLKEKVKHEPEAVILCNTAAGAIQLEQKNFEQTKKIVEETEAQLNELEGVTTVHARFYELSSSYYRTIGDHSEYYKNALRYLGCLKNETLSKKEEHERAFYLGLAAILGEGIYNFGELLMHPILSSLNGSQDQWLVDLLFALNRGDLEKFNALKPLWSLQADLKAAEVKMRQKICLLCLMEMAFTRPANNRQLTFIEVANKTQLPEDEVELLVMRALSIGLVKGSIDQVDKKIYLIWVQPRVLDLSQIKMMRGRIDTWSNEVNKMIGEVQTNAQEILT
jgi:26S proteasome regulatory subunit N9